MDAMPIDERRENLTGQVVHETVEGIEVLTLNGSFDFDVTLLLDRTLRALIERGAKQLLVDLTQVSYMVSTAFRVLLNTQMRLTLVGGRLRVICPEESSLRRVFWMTRLDGVLTLHDSFQSARAAFH